MINYRISAPVSTHFRPSTCAEAGCEAHANGWTTVCDLTTDLGRRQAAYIRHGSGRRFVEVATGPGVVEFRFGPGQRCFATHQLRLDREPDYLIDRRQVGVGQWLDDFATNQQRLKELIDRG